MMIIQIKNGIGVLCDGGVMLGFSGVDPSAAAVLGDAKQIIVGRDEKDNFLVDERGLLCYGGNRTQCNLAPSPGA